MDFLCRVINRSTLHERDINGYETYVVKHAPFIISKLTECCAGTYIGFFWHKPKLYQDGRKKAEI